MPCMVLCHDPHVHEAAHSLALTQINAGLYNWLYARCIACVVEAMLEVNILAGHFNSDLSTGLLTHTQPDVSSMVQCMLLVVLSHG